MAFYYDSSICGVGEKNQHQFFVKEGTVQKVNHFLNSLNFYINILLKNFSLVMVTSKYHHPYHKEGVECQH